MACNCGTKEEIEKLYRVYGDKMQWNADADIIGKIKQVFYIAFTLLCWIVVIPFMTIYLLWFLFWRERGNRTINVQEFNLLKLLHKGKYARE